MELFEFVQVERSDIKKKCSNKGCRKKTTIRLKNNTDIHACSPPCLWELYQKHQKEEESHGK